MQLRNIGRAKCIVYRTNPTVGKATALPAHYVSTSLMRSVRYSIARAEMLDSGIGGVQVVDVAIINMSLLWYTVRKLLQFRHLS